MLNNIWTLITNNAAAISVIIAAAGLLGGGVTFLIRTIYGLFSKTSKKKANTISQLKSDNGQLMQKVSELQIKLNQYDEVEKSPDGDVFIQKKNATCSCPVCWGTNRKTTPVFDDGTGNYKCPICNQTGVYSVSSTKEYEKKKSDAWKKATDDMIAINQSRNQNLKSRFF